jgi:nucleoside-diphosphate-sugar epimerase
MANKVLITGANGFIGSHFTCLMESLGYNVVPIDVVPRSPDLALLGVNGPSHIIDVADAAPYRLRSPLDISLAKKKLDWSPKIYLDEGIARLAHWLVKHRNALQLTAGSRS